MMNPHSEHRLIYANAATYKKVLDETRSTSTAGQRSVSTQATSYTPTQAAALSGGGIGPEYTAQLDAGRKFVTTSPLQSTGTFQGSTGGFTDPAEVQGLQDEYYKKNGATNPQYEAYIQNLNDRLQVLQNGGDTLPAGVQDPVLIAQMKAANAAEAKSIMDQLAAQKTSQVNQANASAMSAAAGQKTLQPFGNRTSAEGIKANLDRQGFIEQQRAQGKSDQEIRRLIATLPPEQTGATTPAPQPPTTDTTSGIPNPADTQQPTGGPKKPDGTTGENGEQAAPVDPNSNLLRTIAGTVQDPILQAILNHEADELDRNAVGDPMGQAEFMQGADAQAIAKPYDAIDKILDRAYQTSQRTYAAQDKFLKGQYDRDEKLLASREENTKNQLSFANDKAVRDQADANKKMLDSQTIMLALQGGFGSSDGNKEIADARLKGEQAIIDLNKEFGFKRADISLAFTEMHNQASDAYTQAWLAATDNFENRVSNLDLQGISNQQAKSNALGGAYKDYVNDIKTARKENAKSESEASKWVYEQMSGMRQEKAAQEARTKDDAYQLFNFAFSNSTDTALRTAAVNAMRKAGYELPENIDLNAAPVSMQLKAMQDAKDTQSVSLTDPFRFTDSGQRQIMSDAYQAVSSLPVALQGPQLEQVAKLLDFGDIAGADAKLKSIAVSSLNDTQRDAFADRSTILNSVSDLEKTLSKLQNNGRGIYTKKYSDMKKFANESQDPEYLAISAALENVAGIMIKERYGANVTGPEWERAQTYIPMSGDTVLDALGKLRKLKDFTQDKNDEVLNAKLGRFSTNTDYSQSSTFDDDYMKDNIVLPGQAKPTSMRTDRHNNPTAFTVDVAKNGGLIEGVDYVAGDPFPNNPKQKTARLLGDPVDTTIRLINKIGFFTQKGQQRWTHTAIPQSEWNGMTYAQKKNVIKKMYSNEGGQELASIFSTT